MEMAFVASSRLQTELNAQSSLRGKVIAASNRPQLFIASMLVGNNLALVIVAWNQGAHQRMAIWGLGMAGGHQPMVVSHATLITTAVVLVLAEFMPKSLFHASPNVWLRSWRIPCCCWLPCLPCLHGL